jgi:hypothetical protein
MCIDRMRCIYAIADLNQDYVTVINISAPATPVDRKTGAAPEQAEAT